MRIRRLRKTEIERAAHVIRRNYSASDARKAKLEFEAMFGDSPVKPTYLVAELNKEAVGIVGYVQSWMDYRAYEVFWVNVLPEHQSQGIGTRLMTHVLALLRKKKPAFILLTARNHRYGFYKKKFGFKSVGQKGTKRLMCLTPS